MPRKSRFDLAFEDLWGEFKASTKRQFFSDIQGQLEEDDDIRKSRVEPQFLAVSFDRKPNDEDFSYHYFDLALVIPDAIFGGSGFTKPVNQLRVLRWEATRADLLKVLNYLAAQNRELRFRRVLIVPFPSPIIGRRLDRSTHMR
jgi:hypothetical protein